MFQLFHLDVAYLTVAIHIYCNYMFQMFHLFSMYVVSVLSGCYMLHIIHICWKRIFQLSHLVSVCCSRCCSPHATRTHLALSRSVPKWPSTPWSKCIRACRSPDVHTRASTQWGTPCTTRFGPSRWSMQSGSTRVCVLCSHPLSRMQLGKPHAHALPCKRSSSTCPPV
jgi:hypothetical protein